MSEGAGGAPEDADANSGASSACSAVDDEGHDGASGLHYSGGEGGDYCNLHTDGKPFDYSGAAAAPDSGADYLGDGDHHKHCKHHCDVQPDKLKQPAVNLAAVDR